MSARKSPAKLVTMPAELWARIDAAAGERGRSAFLALAAERELAALERVRGKLVSEPSAHGSAPDIPRRTALLRSRVTMAATTLPRIPDSTRRS